MTVNLLRAVYPGLECIRREAGLYYIDFEIIDRRQLTKSYFLHFYYLKCWDSYIDLYRRPNNFYEEIWSKHVA